MGEGSTLLDTIFLVAGLVVILLITLRPSGRRSGSRRAVEGQRVAAFAILIWLGLFGFALYLIFG